MLDRVDMDVVEMRHEISVVADGVLPESPLPDGLLAFGTPALAALRVLMGLEIAASESFLDQTPSGREIRVALGQSPERMQVVRKDDVGIDLEGMTRTDLLDGSQEKCDRPRFSQQRAPMLGDEREEITSAGDADAPVSHPAVP